MAKTDEEVAEAEGKSEAEVNVKGKGRTVDEALKKAGLRDQAKGTKPKLNDLLQDPRNKIVVRRVFPKTFRGPDGKSYDCEDIVEVPPPMTLDEITAHLRQELGGKKWNLQVKDEDGEVLDAKNIDIPGDPKINPDEANSQFSIPNDFTLPEDEEEEVVEEDPLDREIKQKAKESKVLELERQNAELRRKIKQASKGNGNGLGDDDEEEHVDVGEAIAEALAKQDEKHQAELRLRDEKEEKQSMEKRLTDKLNSEIGSLRTLIEGFSSKSKDDGANASSFRESMTKLDSKLDNLQTKFTSDLKDTLGGYKEATNTQIQALKDNFASQISNLQNSINNLANRPAPENPMKDMLPLITGSMDRSSASYKEMMGPLITAVTASKGEESGGGGVMETIQMLQTVGALPGSNRDFGTRVVDFAEKMAPDVLNFIKEERNKGVDVTKEALQNQMKLVAAKISKEVTEHSVQEIRRLDAQRNQQQRGLPAPAAQQGQQQPGPQPGPQQQAPVPQQQNAPSPTGRMSPQEIASRQRVEKPPVAEEPDEDEGDEEEGPPLTPEQEMAERVNATLELLEREMTVRPRKVTWPTFAWDELPGQVLDQIIFSNDDADVYTAIKPYADPALADRIWAKIKAEPQSKEFIVAGINLIKGWAIKLQEQQRAEAQQGTQEAPAQQG